jgi:hypothetical protein
MKWYNKQRRRKHWHVIPYHAGRVKEVIALMRAGEYRTISALKQWGQQHDSTGGFFYSQATGCWYFEKGEDAVLFKLKFL